MVKYMDLFQSEDIKKNKMRLIIAVSIFLSIMSLSYSDANAQNIFYLKDVAEKSDINYAGLSNVNEYNSAQQLLDSVFNIKEGNYKVYRFIREIVPVKKDRVNEDTISQELIVLKVSGTTIIEAYYCPLHWKEPPVSSVLLKSKNKVPISQKVKVEELLFEPYDPDMGINILDNDSILSMEKAPPK
jgi:hypothetical protein